MNGQKVLGIEGTAWSLSAAIVGHDKVYAEANNPYIPESGGIHPMMAAQHHATFIGDVVRQVIDSGVKFDGVAFSRAPGSGLVYAPSPRLPGRYRSHMTYLSWA